MELRIYPAAGWTSRTAVDSDLRGVILEIDLVD